MTVLALLLEVAWSAPLLAILLGAARPSLPGALAIYAAAWAAVRLGGAFGALTGAAAVAAAAVGTGLVTYRVTASGAAAVLLVFATLAIGLRLAYVQRGLSEPGHPPGAVLPAAGSVVALALYRLAPGSWPADWGHPAWFAGAVALFGTLLLAEGAAAPRDAAPGARGGRRVRLAAALALGGATTAAAGFLLTLLTPATAGALLKGLGTLLGQVAWYLGVAFFHAFRWIARLPGRWRPQDGDEGALLGEAVRDPLQFDPIQPSEGAAAVLGLIAAAAAAILLLWALRRALGSAGTGAADPEGFPDEDASPLDDEPQSWGRAARRWWRRLTGAAGRDPDPQVERVRAAFRQVLAGWSRAGQPQAPVETPAEFSRRVGGPPTDPDTAAALEELRRLYERARYGRAAGSAEAARAESLARRARPH